MTLGTRTLLMGLAALVAIWGGARVYSHRQPPQAPASVPAGQASAALPSDFLAEDPRVAATRIPARLPAFSLTDLSGKSSSISQWSGKSLVINFWATWCAPCQREIPLLKTLATQWAGRGVTVVGIAVDYRDKVAAFADQFKIGYPLMVGEQDALDVAAQFGMDSPAFPFTVFTDRRGEIVALFVGELHPPQVDLILSQVADLDQNLTQLPEARRIIAAGLAAMPPARS